jgi:large subunit ribosomal protein L23
MAFIIKPLVTEKMNQISEKSSVEKKLHAANAKSAQKHGATEEKVSYKVKKSNRREERSKEKTYFTYTKPARPKYGFIVSPEANKLQIKEEVESLYNVTVVGVNTLRYAGKRSQRYTKAGLIRGQKAAFKKAIVTLKEGDTIDFYSNI